VNHLSNQDYKLGSYLGLSQFHHFLTISITNSYSVFNDHLNNEFFRNSIKDDNINPEVHNLQSLVHNIETVQCPTPMQTDEDSQMKLSDCLTV